MNKLGARLKPGVIPSEVGDGAARLPDDLVRAFSEMRDELVSTLWFILRNTDDAQDAAQDAFLKCWRNRQELSEVRDLRAWIFRIALNAAKDLQRSGWRRRVRRLLGGESMLAAHETAPAQSLEDREMLDRLRRAVLDLRDEERQVFLLRQNGELTYEQIAEIRGAPVGTVKTQMRAALQKLRQQLG
jgi:RNA polymerase sigma-70 factor (ECF subfamily)